MNQISEPEMRKLLGSSEEYLLQNLGQDLMGPQAFPMPVRELVEGAERWLGAQTSYLQTHICNKNVLRKAVTESDDSVSIVIELVNLLTSLVLPVNPITLAVLLTKRGLKSFCASQWTKAND
jgi:hypothetical protein